MAKPIKLIKTEAEYHDALSRIDELMEAKAGTAEGDELELIAALVELYEDRRFPIALPSPVEAIRFRMEQAGLTPSGLVPYLGSKSKVSEVLRGKRPLTLSMMRALNRHLGIPAEVLLQEPGASFPDDVPEINWKRFPLKEMARRGWIERVRDLPGRAEELMRGFIQRAVGSSTMPRPLTRKKDGARRNAKMDQYALAAWCLRVLELARSRPLANKYKPGTVTPEWLGRLARLSYFDDGPRLAKEFLAKSGLHLIVVPHLPHTYLDGAVMLFPNGTPVVGLTLRFDRIDHFWFCLLHELGHVGRHLSPHGLDFFVDDLDLRKAEAQTEDRMEQEADEWAERALIPKSLWDSHPIRPSPKPSAVVELAEQLGIHPAIIAGRIQFEKKNYRLLAHYVGWGEVRKHFEEVPCA